MYPDDWELDVADSWGIPLGTPLTIYRLKPWGEKGVLLELQPLYDDDEWEQIKRRRKPGLSDEPES